MVTGGVANSWSCRRALARMPAWQSRLLAASTSILPGLAATSSITPTAAASLPRRPTAIPAPTPAKLVQARVNQALLEEELAKQLMARCRCWKPTQPRSAHGLS
ncbi:hypothetical protein BDW68DRAFT_172071 [Aspergillus falconensis]